MMDDTSAESLLSLTCPLILNPAQGVEKDKKPLRRLPFPEIDLNSEGFIFSHFPWIGINMTNKFRRKPLVQLAVEHELCHKKLAHTAFSTYKKENMFTFYRMLASTFDKGEEQIPVPLRLDVERNDLEHQWNIVARVMRWSMLVEEVYAIRSSLLAARAQKWIKDDNLLKVIETLYKQEYGKLMPEVNSSGHTFQDVYEQFDFVAGKIGETAATAIIHNVLETIKPGQTFIDILFKMCKIDPLVPNGFVWDAEIYPPEEIANLSFEQVYHGCTILTNYLDPDDSRYERKYMLEVEKYTKDLWSYRVEHTEDDFVKFFFSSPGTFLFTSYTDSVQPFSKIPGHSEELDYGNMIIVVEAIRQQLTTGKGLLCPFWEYSPGNCCGDKEFLENVWKCTCDSSCENWTRQGCLNLRVM